MKVNIKDSDLYPFFYVEQSFIQDPDSEVEIDDKTFKEWGRVMSEFKIVQKEMRSACNDPYFRNENVS